MAQDEIKAKQKVPEPTLRRLPWYLAYVKLLKGKGETVVSSTQISKVLSIEASQVVKDLSFVKIGGKTRVGYDLDELIFALDSFLGFTSSHKAFLFGVGSLGAALLQDSGLKQYGLEIVAGFDIREELVGTIINGIPVYHINHYPQYQKQHGATIGVITVRLTRRKRLRTKSLPVESKDCGISPLSGYAFLKMWSSKTHPCMPIWQSCLIV